MKNTNFWVRWCWGKKKKADDDDDDSTESQGGSICIDKNIIVVMQCKQERTETREKWQVFAIYSKSYTKSGTLNGTNNMSCFNRVT